MPGAGRIESDDKRLSRGGRAVSERPAAFGSGGRDTARAMSETNPEAVRQPLRLRPRSARTLDQRLSVRFPRLAVEVLRPLGQLPPRSRLRRAALLRAVGLALEAYNRRDLDAVVAAWDPGFEYRPDPAWVKAGLVDSSYYGAQGYRRYIATADEVWGGENHLAGGELIDLGEQFVVLADVSMRAQASGVPLTEAYAVVTTVADGRIVLHEEYFDHAQALEAAGLREQVGCSAL
jgi:ketosteroid isomerase-like protein